MEERRIIMWGAILVIVFGGLCVATSMESSGSSRATLYVGGGGPGNYTTIQSAIDDATAGDTIFVYNGTYYENVVVNKTVTLIGEDKNTTIIDGDWSGNVITISADDVTISGFTIQHGEGSYLYAGIDIRSNGTIINDNTIANNGGLGLNLEHSSNNTITGNTIYNNTYTGIYLLDSSNNSISGNKVYINNYDGIHLIVYSNNNNLTGNTVYNNTGDGIAIGAYSNNNNLTGNTVYNNTRDGVQLYSSNNSVTGNNVYNNNIYGIFLASSSNIIITGNTVYNNSYDGINLYSSSNIIIAENTVYNNTDSGIRLYSSNNSIIMGNTVYNNTNQGIFLYFSNNHTVTGNSAYNNNRGIWPSDSSNISVTGNNASANVQYGIYLNSVNNSTVTGNNAYNNDYGISLQDSSTISVAGNNAMNNSRHGIYISFSSNITIMENTAYNNTEDGIRLYSSSNNVIAENNAYNNTEDGIHLVLSSSSNIIMKNILTSNDYGIHLSSSCTTNNITGNNATNNNYGIYLYFSSDNTIYDNYFNNTNNAHDSTGNNIWNITKTAGVNIVGGLYMGGNYWNNYMGGDTSGDGLGDTLLPYSTGISTGGDSHPLVILPVENLDTGETFYTIQAAIDDSHTDDGDTIKVPARRYEENVVIYKEVKIVGDPVLDGMGGIGFSVEANNTHIENFTVFNCSEGIYVRNASFTLQNVTIDNCTVYDCTGNGITCNDVNGSAVNSSHIYGNSGGIYLYASSNTRLGNNTLTGNTYNFGVYGWDISHYYHDVNTSNTINGRPVYYMVNQTSLSFNNTSMGYLGLVSCNNTRMENLSLSNNFQGILTANTSYSTIINCSVDSNYYGIYLDRHSSHNQIHFSDIYHNTYYGVYNNNSGNQADATYNWWGSEDGPYHPTLNPDGHGDNISDYVVFEPWIEHIPPVTTLSYTGGPHHNGGTEDWITSSTQLSLAATDGGSGVNATYYRIDAGAWNEYTVPFTIPVEGMHTLYYYSVDNLGNTEALHTRNVNVDDSPPATTCEFGSPYYTDGMTEWIALATPVYLNATDHPGHPSGVREIRYDYGDGWNIVYGDTAVFTIPDEGRYTIQWYAVDNLGHAESLHTTDVTVILAIYIFDIPAGETTLYLSDNDALLIINSSIGNHIVMLCTANKSLVRGWPGDARPVGDFIDIIIDDPEAILYPIYLQINYTMADLIAAGYANEYNDLYGIAYYNETDGDWHRCSDTGVNTTNFDGYQGYCWAYLSDGELSPKVIMTRIAPIGGVTLPVHTIGLLIPYISVMALLALMGVALIRNRRRN